MAVAIPGAESCPVHGRDGVLGVVLAGGAGSRVGGVDKGLLPLAGRPLIDHVLDALRPQCDQLLVVANRNCDEYAGRLPAIHDEIPGHAGPLAGLAAAFGFVAANRHAQWAWLLTVPVDCPRPPHDLAARLHAALGARVAARCAVARRAGRTQPLFALYRTGAAVEAWQVSARAALEAHGSPMRWHAELGALAVDFDAEATAFHNLNSLDDFAGYERTHAGS